MKHAHYNRHTRRPCRYPFAAVQEARKLRRHGFTYKEISQSLEQTHGIKVSLFTVRDWIDQAFRMMG